MKTRIITGIIAALFAISLLVVIGFGFTKYLFVVASVFSAIAVYEIMRVSHCENKVISALNSLNGVIVKKVSFKEKKAVIACDKNLLDIDIINLINGLGYEVKNIER